MKQLAQIICMFKKHLLLVVDIMIARINAFTLNIMSPAGVLYADGCGCQNCDCK